jgi:hypothetical protein
MSPLIKPLSPGADAPAVGYLEHLLRGRGYSYLADSVEASHFGSRDFRVGGRIFATLSLAWSATATVRYC